jgi:hypothetical protein
MTTELDADLQQDVYDASIELGVDVLFRTYPSLTQDDAESTVTKGPSTDFTVKCFPPEHDFRSLGQEDDGDEFETDSMKVWLPTGVGALKADGTSAAIGFTPKIGMEVVFRSKTWRIAPSKGKEGIEVIQPGDDILMYALYLAE